MLEKVKTELLFSDNECEEFKKEIASVKAEKEGKYGLNF